MSKAAKETGNSMSHLDALTYIIKRRDEEHANWDEITDDLRRHGYRSERTGRPIKTTAVRISYYNAKKRAKGREVDTQEQLHQMLKAVVDLNTGAESKIELIRTLLKQSKI